MKKILSLILIFSLISPVFANIAIDDRDDIWWNQNSSFRHIVKPKEKIKPIIVHKKKSKYDEIYILYGGLIVFVALISLTNEGSVPRGIKNFALLNAMAGGGYLVWKFGDKKRGKQ
jgi:hypothetical protein